MPNDCLVLILGRNDITQLRCNIHVCRNSLFQRFIFILIGMYPESLKALSSIEDCPIKLRMLFHLAHKLNDENRLIELHGQLGDAEEDHLSLGALHFFRSHYQDAIDVYKRILLAKK